MEGINGELDDGERLLRKMAIEHVATLPDKHDDALKVMGYMMELVCDYLEKGRRPKPVILRVISAETE